MKDPDRAGFFRYTRARFVQNEAEEMRARYVHYNLSELGKAAARAIGARQCLRLEQLADGMHNKALLLTMDDNSEVVAKIPFPIAGPQHLTIASEVATMQFMRRELAIPVPNVVGWCSRASDSSVGAAYILMQKAPGISLKSVWPRMDLRTRFGLVKEIAKFQTAWSSAPYPGYGSIYFTADLTPEQRIPLRSEGSTETPFCIGPTIGRDWLDNNKHAVTFDRGPWDSLQDYLEAVGHREMACVRDLPRLPPTQVTLCGPGTYEPTREKKIRALEYYLKAIPYLMPKSSTLGKPSAWHSDLHLENIFVDSNDPMKITCLIDWQSTEVAPHFVQARQPYLLDHVGPAAIGLDRPRMPKNFNELTEHEKKAATNLCLAQSLCVAYKTWVQSTNPDLWECFEFQNTPEFDILLFARSLLVDGEAIFASQIVDLLTNGTTLKDSGLYIPETTQAEIQSDAEGALRGMKAMTEVQEAMGDIFPERGCVKVDEYDLAKDGLRQAKKQIIDHFAMNDAEKISWEKHWPFDD